MRWFWLGLGPGASVILGFFMSNLAWAGSPAQVIPLAQFAGVSEMEARIQPLVLSLSERWQEDAQAECFSPDLREWKTKHWAAERGIQSVSVVTRMAQAREQEKRLEDLISSGAHWSGMQASARLARERGRDLAAQVIQEMLRSSPFPWRFLSSECGAEEGLGYAPLEVCHDPLQRVGIEALVAFNEVVSRDCRPFPSEFRKPQGAIQAALDQNRDEYVRRANGGLHEILSFSTNVSEGLALNYAMVEIELFKKRMLERQKDVLDRVPNCSPYGE